MKVIYKEAHMVEKMKTFNVDQAESKLLILSKSTSTQKATEKNDHFFKIYDLTTQDIVYQDNLHNKELVGRLKSGLYTFVQGHIYYKNNVIKIRYDLIEKYKDR